MKFLKFNILILILLKIVFAFDSDHICKQENLNCSGYYSYFGIYRTKCIPYNCVGKFSYKCDNTNCAINQESCNIYLAIRSNLMRALISPSTYKIQFRKHEKHLNNIKKCPSSYNQLKPNDACIRLKECYVTQINPLYENTRIIKKKAECLCDSGHSFECNTSYCTINKEACDILSLELAQNSTTKLHIEKCKNNNFEKTIERIILF